MGSIQLFCAGNLQVSGLFALQGKGELEQAQQLESYDPHGSSEDWRGAWLELRSLCCLNKGLFC